ncbi:hypothetical protein M8C21_025775 [Ambrosia artemisiifolia]|uniref:FCP1 homology domain-containing protein n=1 Tax=Ambrosia artemisiifolia TaxID=4212 RepID=A0AAD5CDM4_AMBAR|nr:hypothetical protein M8C21_025775 [Ambrosia artemisiifolia]
MEVMTSSPVKECSLMEIDDGNGALILTKSKRKRGKKDCKRPLNANLGLLETTDTDISDTVDKMSSSKGKECTKVASGTNVGDNTAKRRKREAMKNDNPDLGDILSSRESTKEGSTKNETVSGKTTTLDADMGSKERGHAEAGNGKTGESETTDLNVNDNEKGKKRRKAKNKRPTLGEILNTQCLQSLEGAKGETGSGTILIDNSASEKETVQKLNKNPDSGDILSTRESIQEGLSTTKVLEVKSGETVSAKAAAPDAEVANGKGEGETANLIVNSKEKKKRKVKSKNKRPTVGDILNPQCLQNLEAARGEMDSGTTSTGNSVSQQRKREKTMNKNPDLGDILSTRVSTQEGLITAKVFEVKSGETVLAKAASIDANIVSNGDHAEVSVGKTGESETTKLNVNGKEKKKPKSKNKRPTLGEILNPQYLQNLEAAERGSGTHESRQKGQSTTKVLEVKSGKIVSGKTATSDANMVSKGDHTKVVNGKMQKNETTNLNVNGKEKKNNKMKPKSKNKGNTIDVLVKRPEGIVADKYLPRRAVFKRPYVDDFLCFCFERFEVAIWSSRVMKNLVPVINFLFGDLRKKLLFMWASGSCRNSGIATLEAKHKNVVVKDLRKIWDENGPRKFWVKGTFHESNTLLVDDSPYKALLNPNRLEDKFLAPKGELQTYLEGWAAADDVKTYVEQHPFGQGAIDEQSPHWDFYSNIIERLNDPKIMASLSKKKKKKRRR